jgi:GT2 family glycosyltransferase
VEAILQHFPHVKVIETGQNLGFAGGNNVGIQWGLEQGFEEFLLLNNDTLVAPDLMEQFSKAAREYPAVGIFGAKIYLQSDPMRLDHLGGNWNAGKAKMDFIGMRALDDGKSFEAPLPLDYVCGAAMFIRREVFEKIGFLDPRFFLFWEETDFCSRAKRAGFGVQFCPQAKIWHKVSATANKEGKPFKMYFHWRNSLLWMERNLSWKEKFLPFVQTARCFIKDSIQLQLRHLKLPFLRRFRPASAIDLEMRMHQQKAKLYGIRDYLLRRFGPGSSSRLSRK